MHRAAEVVTRLDCLGRPIRAKTPFHRADRVVPPPLGVWRLRAACRVRSDIAWLEQFFPPPGSRAHEAKRVCAGCEVAAECLDYALQYPQDGVWGGTTAHQRTEIAKGRR